MPLFSTKRNISDAQNKLRVLFCLNALEIATQDELWPFVAQLDLMDYVPFCVFVDELKKDGAVAGGTHALAGALYLTPEGQQQLALFSDKLPSPDRSRILETAPVYLAKLRARKQVRAAYAPPPDGGYGAELIMREGDVPTLMVRLCTDDEKLAECAVRGFESCAPLVLNLLYTLDLKPGTLPIPDPLSQEEAMGASVPGTPQLCAFGGREHAAVVKLCDGATCYTVLLLLPTADTAWAWAQSADAYGHELAAALTAFFASGEAGR